MATPPAPGNGMPPQPPQGMMPQGMPQGMMPQGMPQGMPQSMPQGMPQGMPPQGMMMPSMPGQPGCGMPQGMMTGTNPGMPGQQQGMPGMMPGMMGGQQPGGSGMPQGMPGGAPGMMPGMMMPGMMPGMNPMMMMMMQQMQQGMKQGQAGNGAAAPNPMAAMMMGGMGGSMGSKAQAAEQPKKAPEPEDDDDTIDPDIQELCDYFNIEDRWIKRLNETMKKRQDTKAEDIEKLYETLERARSPTGLLTVKIGEMESGRFVGKIKPDKDVERLARKFKLDDPVASRLTELIHRRKKDNEIDRMHKDLATIEQHLRYCKRANAMATLLVGKLLEGDVEELPDLADAEKIMEKYKLDEDAKSKLREIVEKRAEDQKEVLVTIKKHLDTCANPSSMLCKIARPLIDNEHLADPPERGSKGGDKGGGKGKDKDKGGGDRDRDRRDRSRGRRDRSRSRRRDKSRSRSRRRRDD